MNPPEINKILTQACNGSGLRRGDIRSLLRLSGASEVEALFKAARQVRQRFAADRIFLYGFLYVSTHCGNNCRFCQFRRDNHHLRRYRKNSDQILAGARLLAASGVHLIDLTMGEDAAFLGSGRHTLPGLVGSIRESTGLPVMVSPGVLPSPALERLAAAGADWYACYQETHSKALFKQLRSGQDFDRRMAAKKTARAAGMLVEEGILCGIGESDGQVADSLKAMQTLDADQVRVMNFIPQPGAPLTQNTHSGNLRERIIIAVMRLAFPGRMIPASLDVEGLKGLGQRLDAGANVVTSLVPPGKGFCGVASSELDIDNARRTVPAVRRVIEAHGLRVAGPEALRQWMADRRSGRVCKTLAGRPA